MTVDVQDVYDEFGYGVAGTAPIHDFLYYAYQNWGASYAVLVGDGNDDPKKILTDTTNTSFIPSYLAFVPTPLYTTGLFANGEIAVDNRYVTFPDALGDKHAGYDAGPAASEYARGSRRGYR